MGLVIVISMTPPAIAVETDSAQVTEAISFAPVPCLLSLEELSTKVEEQVLITWNGLNGY